VTGPERESGDELTLGTGDLSDLLGELSLEPSDRFQPWEQRLAPGAGPRGPMPRGEEPANPARVCAEVDDVDLVRVVERQADLVHYAMLDLHSTPDTDISATATSNEQVWRMFLEEELYDTRRVTLEHVHLFEWFPAAPGRFHTPEGRAQRQMAYRTLTEMAGGIYFTPSGKASLLQGGLGAVRLRPRQIGGESHYFFTASSNGVCHEGFPVLVPRRFYGPLKARFLREGAVPVTLSGEMRYVPDDTVTFLGGARDVPMLYLHVDQLTALAAPRSEVSGFLVTAGVSFVGRFEGREGLYATFASFDPGSRAELDRAVDWLQEVYVEDQYQGTIVTDFDEVRPRFPNAVFGLPDLMSGELDQDRVRALLEGQGLDVQPAQPYYVVYREINTHGGAYIEGDVHVHDGDFRG